MKREIAENYFKQGFNCAQSVALAFKDDLGIDETTILKLVSPFGGGMGRMREVCGAVSGMLLVLGSKYGYSDPKDAQSKSELYSAVQSLMGQFKDKNGSYICRELLGENGRSAPTPEKRTDEYYKKRPCVLLVGDAAEILEEYIKGRE